MSAFDIYIFGVIEKITFILGFSGFTGLLICLFLLIPALLENFYDSYKKYFFKLCTLFLFMIVTSTLLPDRLTLAAMYIIPAVQEDENLKELFGDSLDVISLYFDKWKEDLNE